MRIGLTLLGAAAAGFILFGFAVPYVNYMLAERWCSHLGSGDGVLHTTEDGDYTCVYNP